MKTEARILLLAALLAGTNHNLYAQGTAFTYQGRLYDSNSVAGGNYDLRFTVYDSTNLPGNWVAGPVVNSATPVTNGLFTVTLDFGPGVFNGATRALEVAARTNGTSAFTVLSPRQPVTALPYAVLAANVSGTVAASQLSGQITGSQLAAGSITADKLVPGAVSALGAPDGSPTNAVIINNNGLVGIGATNPAAGLQIASGAPLTTLIVQFEVQDGQKGYTNLGSPTVCALNGNLLAVGANSGVTLDNIATPSSPLLQSQIYQNTGVFTNLSDVTGLAWAGSNLVAAAYNSSAVTIISCTNPSSPVKIAELRNGFNGWNYLSGTYSVAVSGNLLAIGAFGNNAVTLADLSNPSVPLLKSTLVNGSYGFTNLGGVISVALSGNLLAIGARDSSAVTLVNAADPANPRKLAELINGVGGYGKLGGIASVALSGNLLAIAALNSSVVTLVDVSTPSAPVKLAELANGVGGYSISEVYSVTISGNRLAIGSQSPGTATLVDVSNPPQPVLLATATTGLNGADYLEGVTGLALAGTNLAVCGYSANGLTILGIGGQSEGLSSAGWVGIGTTHPAAALDVVGNVLVENATLFDVNAQRVALGMNAKASGAQSAALGYNAVASGDFAVTLGDNSAAGGKFSTALGSTAVASGDYSQAMGFQAYASAPDALALGDYARASGTNATALGLYAVAASSYSFALGYNSWATNVGSLVWADFSSPNYFYSAHDNEFAIRAHGGARFVTAGTGMTVDGPVTAGNFIGSGPAANTYYNLIQMQTNLFMNDNDLQFRGDLNHGVGWYGGSKPFGTFSPDGPVLYGYGGGGLGTVNNGYSTNLALTWNSGSVTVDGSLNVTDSLSVNGPVTAYSILSVNNLLNANGSLLINTNAFLNDNDLQLRNDKYHGLGFYGGSKTFAGLDLNGPALYGNTGGALGTKGSTTNAALAWDSAGNVIIDPTSANTGSLVPGLTFGAGSGEGICSKRSSGIGQFCLDFYTGGAERMRINNNGSVAIGTTSTAYEFQVGNAYCDGSAWYPSSDRNVKTGFEAVTPAEILSKVAALPISRWYYTNGAAVPHVGPMAQDFHAAFGLGPDDRHIADIDEGGVALAAIQGLNQKVETQQRQLEQKDAEINELKARLEKLEHLINAQTAGNP